MRYIDLHCDTITELAPAETLKDNNKCVNIGELTRAEVLVQCCSMFVPTGIVGCDRKGERLSPKLYRQKIESECDRIYATYQKEMQDNKDTLRAILKSDDIEKCVADKKTGILLTIEDGGVLFGEVGRLESMYDKGVRLITLTWNHENELGYPNSQDKEVMGKGLKHRGIEMVQRMFELGVLVDVSHLSDGGFYDVARIARRVGKPMVASHSNSRTITAHPRNMTDDMIKVLAECGGVMGLNLAPHFLNEAQGPKGNSRIEDMVRHILHIRNVGGSEVLAIGSDFDGIEGSLEIGKPTDFQKLWDALVSKGIPIGELEKMWQTNALRILT